MKYAIERRPLFPLGQRVATPDALAALKKAGQSPAEFLSLHVRGQWGDIPWKIRRVPNPLASRSSSGSSLPSA